MVKDYDHGNVEGLQNTFKSCLMKFRNHLCMGLGCQMQCKVKINFIEISTYYNAPEKGNYLFHVNFYF